MAKLTDLERHLPSTGRFTSFANRGVRLPAMKLRWSPSLQVLRLRSELGALDSDSMVMYGRAASKQYRVACFAHRSGCGQASSHLHVSNAALPRSSQEEAYQHSYAYDWRTKQPIIFRATDQWFASVDGFRRAALHRPPCLPYVADSSDAALLTLPV